MQLKETSICFWLVHKNLTALSSVALCSMTSFVFYVCVHWSVLSTGSVAYIWFEQPPQYKPRVKMQPDANVFLMVLMATLAFPGRTNCPCNLFIYLFFYFCVSVSNQTSSFIRFLLAAFDWLHIQVGQRWQGVLSAWGMTLLRRHCLCPLIGLLGQLLVACMHICVCVCVCLCVCVWWGGIRGIWCWARKLEFHRYSQIVVTVFGKWHLRTNMRTSRMILQTFKLTFQLYFTMTYLQILVFKILSSLMCIPVVLLQHCSGFTEPQIEKRDLTHRQLIMYQLESIM